MVPQTTVPVSDEETAKKAISPMEAFEDYDDVRNSCANFDIPDEIMKKIEFS